MHPEDRLARTARRIRPPDGTFRFLLLLIGGTLAFIGLAAPPGPDPSLLMVMAIMGGVIAGYAFRPEADRYYMEGFSDGVEAGARLADERSAARLADGGAGLRPDGPRAAAGGADADQWAAGDTDPVGRHGERGAADGVGSRPARPAVTEDGRPIPAFGPRAPSFPTVAANGTRSIDLRGQVGTAAGDQAADRVGSQQQGE